MPTTPVPSVAEDILPEKKTSECSGSTLTTTTSVPTKELRQSIAKGMQIISEIEQAREDGMVFKFEMDLMYEVHHSREGIVAEIYFRWGFPVVRWRSKLR